MTSWPTVGPGHSAYPLRFAVICGECRRPMEYAAAPDLYVCSCGHKVVNEKVEGALPRRRREGPGGL